MCETGADECTDPASCDEANDICYECLTSADCDNGLFCDGAEVCNTDTYTCETITPACADPLSCDETADICT